MIKKKTKQLCNLIRVNVRGCESWRDGGSGRWTVSSI